MIQHNQTIQSTTIINPFLKQTVEESSHTSFQYLNVNPSLK